MRLEPHYAQELHIFLDFFSKCLNHYGLSWVFNDRKDRLRICEIIQFFKWLKGNKKTFVFK